MSQYDVELKAGGKYLFDLVFRDERRRPADLSAVQNAYLGIRKRRETGAAALTAAMTIVDPNAAEGAADRGRLTYLLTAEKSASLGPGEFEFEVKLDYGDNNPAIAPGWGMKTMRIYEAVTT